MRCWRRRTPDCSPRFPGASRSAVASSSMSAMLKSNWPRCPPCGRWCGSEDAVIALCERDELIVSAHEGPIQHHVGRRATLDRTSAAGRSVLDAQTMHVPDILAAEAAELTTSQNLAREFGFRAVAAVP